MAIPIANGSLIDNFNAPNVAMGKVDSGYATNQVLKVEEQRAQVQERVKNTMLKAIDNAAEIKDRFNQAKGQETLDKANSEFVKQRDRLDFEFNALPEDKKLDYYNNTYVPEMQVVRQNYINAVNNSTATKEMKNNALVSLDDKILANNRRYGTELTGIRDNQQQRAFTTARDNDADDYLSNINTSSPEQAVIDTHNYLNRMRNNYNNYYVKQRGYGQEYADRMFKNDFIKTLARAGDTIAAMETNRNDGPFSAFNTAISFVNMAGSQAGISEADKRLLRHDLQAKGLKLAVEENVEALTVTDEKTGLKRVNYELVNKFGSDLNQLEKYFSIKELNKQTSPEEGAKTLDEKRYLAEQQEALYRKAQDYATEIGFPDKILDDTISLLDNKQLTKDEQRKIISEKLMSVNFDKYLDMFNVINKMRDSYIYSPEGKRLGYGEQNEKLNKIYDGFYEYGRAFLADLKIDNFSKPEQWYQYFYNTKEPTTLQKSYKDIVDKFTVTDSNGKKRITQPNTCLMALAEFKKEVGMPEIAGQPNIIKDKINNRYHGSEFDDTLLTNRGENLPMKNQLNYVVSDIMRRAMNVVADEDAFVINAPSGSVNRSSITGKENIAMEFSSNLTPSTQATVDVINRMEKRNKGFGGILMQALRSSGDMPSDIVQTIADQEFYYKQREEHAKAMQETIKKNLEERERILKEYLNSSTSFFRNLKDSESKADNENVKIPLNPLNQQGDNK